MKLRAMNLFNHSKEDQELKLKSDKNAKI